MTATWSAPLERLAAIDPSPFFVLSLLPYLAFLWWASRVEAFPRLALRGFQLTLLFVAVTIAAAIVAQVCFGALLAEVDPLHGGAEAFLTLSNLVVMLGFVTARTQGGEPAVQGAAEAQATASVSEDSGGAELSGNGVEAESGGAAV